MFNELAFDSSLVLSVGSMAKHSSLKEPEQNINTGNCWGNFRKL